MVSGGLSNHDFIEDLYRSNEHELKSFVKRRMGNAGAVDVDDVVQEAFLRIAALDGSTKIDNPRGFLFRVARNLVFDMLRRNKVRNAYAKMQAADDAPNRGRFFSESAESRASSRQDLELILNAIDNLPEQCRQVFLMQRRDGLTYAKLAGRLGISESMVQKHMSKALNRINKVLP